MKDSKKFKKKLYKQIIKKLEIYIEHLEYVLNNIKILNDIPISGSEHLLYFDKIVKNTHELWNGNIGFIDVNNKKFFLYYVSKKDISIVNNINIPIRRSDVTKYLGKNIPIGTVKKKHISEMIDVLNEMKKFYSYIMNKKKLSNSSSDILSDILSDGLSDSIKKKKVNCFDECNESNIKPAYFCCGCDLDDNCDDFSCDSDYDINCSENKDNFEGLIDEKTFYDKYNQHYQQYIS